MTANDARKDEGNAAVSGNREEMVKPSDSANLPKAFYHIRQREGLPWQLAASRFSELPPGTVVIVNTEHGREPVVVMEVAPITFSLPAYMPKKLQYQQKRQERKAAVESSEGGEESEENGENRGGKGCQKNKDCRPPLLEIVEIAEQKDIDGLLSLQEDERAAFEKCQEFVNTHQLKMKLVRVEQFYNKSKMIFYFTAENRVDFRGLVKDLVQEYRTRIEMRQIGVRHETKMFGGLGICGRELCCAKHLHSFSSISVKMAKEQDLPLNPNKISGVCGRLFCCLTHEYDSYKKERRKMPRIGRRLVVDGKEYTVLRQNVLRRQIIAAESSGEEVTLDFAEWSRARPVKKRENRGGKE